MRSRNRIAATFVIVLGIFASVLPGMAKAEAPTDKKHKLDTPAAVSVVVKDADGRPAAGVGVVVMSHANPAESRKVFDGKTDADGKS